MRLLSLIFTLCLSMVALADLPTLKVVGPSESVPGQLVVLSVESDGANFVWIPDAAIGQILQCNPKTIGLATPNIGVHKIIVVASNDKGEMSFVTHALTIKNPGGVIPPKPDDPVVNPPSKDYTEFKDISQKAVVELKDNPTALQLRNGLNRLIPDLLKLNTVDEAKLEVTKLVESVFLLRVGDSRSKDWLNKWRVPINVTYEKYKFSSVKDYVEAVKMIAEGLEVTTNTVPICPTCVTPSLLFLPK